MGSETVSQNPELGNLPKLGSTPPVQSGPEQKSLYLKGKGFFRLVVAVPFFLPAALYLSLLFAGFSCIPLVYAQLRHGRFLGAISAVTNVVFIWLLAGRTNAAAFLVLAVIPAITISECFRLKIKLDWTVLITVLMMVFFSAALLVSYSFHFHINPFQKLNYFVGEMVDHVAANVERYKATGAIATQDLEKFLIDPEMTKRNILYELPSAVIISLLALVVGNLLLILRLNIQYVRESLGLTAQFFKFWKTPEHMIWPTLVAGAFLVIDIPIASDIALNAFKIFMALYALQGLAITNYLFDVWGVKGILRPLGYTLAVALLLPLVISVGFFDLWFGFREKFKSVSK